MLIQCPECHFERNIDTGTIPANATVATCPRCGNRFRFRDPQSGEPVAVQPDQGQAPSRPDTDVTDTAAPHASAPISPEKSAPPVPHLPTEREGDDPLPPGAVIPSLDDTPDTAPRDRTAAVEAADARKTDSDPAPTEKRLWSGLKDKAAPGRADPASSPRAPGDDDREKDGGKPATSDDGGGPDGVPWEQPDRYGFFPSFYHTLLRVMFRAPDFFRHVRGDAPLTRPAFFYVLLSFFQTVIARLWSMNSLQELSRTVTDPQTLARIDMLMQGLSTPLVLIMTPFLMLIQLFLFAAFYHLMIRLAQPDKADFNTVVRVIAYSAAPLVVSVVPVVGGTVGSLWFLASTFVGCKYALNLSWAKTALALIPLFLLALAVMLALFQASFTLTTVP